VIDYVKAGRGRKSPVTSYGLAGLVKGLGIVALKQLDVMSTLTDKHNPKHREGESQQY